MPKQTKIIGKNLFQQLLQLFQYLSSYHRYQLIILLILMVVSSFTEVVSLGSTLPFLTVLSNPSFIADNPTFKPTLDFFYIQTSLGLILALSTAWVFIIFISTGLRIFLIYKQNNLMASISNTISRQIYNIFLQQNYNFYLLHNSSYLINSLMGDSRKIAGGVLNSLLSILNSLILLFILSTGLYLAKGGFVLFIGMILGVIFWGIYHLRKKQLMRNSKILVEKNKEMIQIIQETFGGIKEILIGEIQDLFLVNHRNIDKIVCNTQAQNSIITQSPLAIIQGLLMIFVIIIALVFLLQTDDFGQVLPLMGTVTLGAIRILPSIQRIFSSFNQIQSCRHSLVNVLIELQRPVNPLVTWIPEEGLKFDTNLQFEKVWFRYSDDGDWILKNLSFTIKAKTTVGFIGGTGSGKSTTADLILGLLKPNQGYICVDGLTIEGKSLRQWQKNIAHVSQQIFLRDASILENIAFGIHPEQINFSRVRKAAQLAQIDEFIETLPLKYNTSVGEGGMRLSGGQRQRLGIARALYKEASVIVFDEATSALDNDTEKEVMAAINNLSNQFTIILIAHRLSTLENCDRVIKFDRGEIVRVGSYEEVISPSNK